jgi:hypothetical protein
MRGVEKHRALLSLGQTAKVVDDDLQTMSRLYSCHARRRSRAREGQETPNSALSKPTSLFIRQSPISPTAASSSSIGLEPPSRTELESLGEVAGKRPASASPPSDLAVPHGATRLKTSFQPRTRLVAEWKNRKTDAGAKRYATAPDVEDVAKTFAELVQWIQKSFRLQDFGCKINFNELRLSTLPPPDGASGLFTTVSFTNTVLTADDFCLGLYAAEIRNQFWISFETIDDSAGRSSPAMPVSIDGSRSSGGGSEDDIVYVKTTTNSSLPITALIVKQECSISPPPEILIPAPAAIDSQSEKSLEDGYESDKDLQAPVFKRISRPEASTDESDTKSETGYAIDGGDIIVEHEADHNKLFLGETEVHPSAELQALAVDKDDIDYDWYILRHPLIPLTIPPTTDFVYKLANKKQVGAVDG